MPLDDLVGIISLPLQIPTFGKGGHRGGARSRVGGRCGCYPRTHGCCAPDGNLVEPRMSASFVPDHKAPMVLFLDRVYGIETQEFLLRLLEVGFLPDMRAAASLDTVSRGVRGPPKSAPSPAEGFRGSPGARGRGGVPPSCSCPMGWGWGPQSFPCVGGWGGGPLVVWGGVGSPEPSLIPLDGDWVPLVLMGWVWGLQTFPCPMG